MKSRHLILLILGLSVLTLFYVRSRFLVVQLSYNINEKSAEKRMLEKKKRELNLELSVLQSPRRIEEIAIKKFGLSYQNEGYQKKVFMRASDK
jgi:cell division protein FtsL